MPRPRPQDSDKMISPEFFKIYFLFWNNCRYIGNCKSSSEKTCIPLVFFFHWYHLVQNQHIDLGNIQILLVSNALCVYAMLSHVEIHITTPAISIKTCFIPTRTLQLSHLPSCIILNPSPLLSFESPAGVPKRSPRQFLTPACLML